MNLGIPKTLLWPKRAAQTRWVVMVLRFCKGVHICLVLQAHGRRVLPRFDFGNLLQFPLQTLHLPSAKPQQTDKHDQS